MNKIMIDFRKATILAGFVLLLLSITSCENQRDTSYLEEITINQLRQGYKDGKFTIQDVVGDYLKRIEDIDKSGPSLNSIITINPDALEIAEKLDKELAEGKIRGPLYGIPVILKDNIDTRDSMPTTAGARFEVLFAKKDSWVAKTKGGRSNYYCQV